MWNRIIFVGVLFVCLGYECIAQGEATRVLNAAEDNFEQGNLATIPRDLDSKYFKKQKSGGFSKEESVRAYRLLTLVHLYNDNQTAAEESFVGLLKADPEHPPTDSDPKEFHFLHEKFNTDPIFRIGIKVGAVRTEVNAFDGFGSSDNNTGSSKSYAPKFNFMAEATFEYQLPKNLELVSGVTFSLEQFETTDALVGTGDINFSLTESQTWIKVPLMLRYNVQLGKSVTPYVYGGYSANLLIGSTLAGSRSGGQPLTVSSVDLISDDLRTRFNQAIIGGVGVKLASKTNFIVIESRYSQGITNVVNSSNRYANQNLIFGSGYVDDNFALNNISFSIGYIKSFYKPRKLSEKKFNKKLQQKLKKSNNE